jgi:hypothetical protein
MSSPAEGEFYALSGEALPAASMSMRLSGHRLFRAGFARAHKKYPAKAAGYRNMASRRLEPNRHEQNFIIRIAEAETFSSRLFAK